MSSALNLAPGLPDLSGIYIPEAWSGKVLVKFYAASVVPAIANTDYEGEIKGQFDRVEIRTTPDVQINDYTLGSPLALQKPTPTKIELQISRAKYWSFLAEDVQSMQSDIDYVNNWTKDAGEQLRVVVDRDVLGSVYADADAANKGNAAGAKSGSINLGVTGTPVQYTSSNALDIIIDCNTVMDEQNLPDEERFIVLPPWAVNRIKRSDLQSAMITGDPKSPLRNGMVGSVDRTLILSSNNLASVADSGGSTAWNCIFGHKSALTFAGQLVKNETIKAETTFGTIYRGLKVYGFKTVKPTSLGSLYIKR